MKAALALGLAAVHTVSAAASYKIARDYSGKSFFDEWDFYGYWDNTTSGDVNFLDDSDAFNQQLAYVNDAGNAVIKVDNTTNVPWNDKRNSIKITSKEGFGVGSLVIFDAVHMPFGCSVWPSFWTHGAAWPEGGEIDIVEGVNGVTNNQYALHATAGCAQASNPSQSGQTQVGDCSKDSGCTVKETKQNSYGSGFASSGGGVYATQIDSSGVFMWFWPRANIPDSIKNAASQNSSDIDISQWGTPSASYPASGCDIAKFFTPQYLVLDITLCGVWGNVAYNDTCANQGSGKTGICYNDNVIGDGSNYANAYFEIPYIRVFTNGNATVTSPSTSASKSSSSSKPTSGSNGASSISAGAATGLAVAGALMLMAQVMLT